MKRCITSNVCFNFYTDPDVVSENDAICDYDVYVIFAECFSEGELTSEIDDVEETAYKIILNEEYSDNEVAQKVAIALDELYGTDPVIDVIIKDRKFLMNANRAAAWR